VLPSLMPIKLQKLWRGLRPELRRIISSRGAWPEWLRSAVPVLIDRRDTWSGNASARAIHQPTTPGMDYRQAYELGRHIIGYEVQKVLGAVDFFEAQTQIPEARRTNIGVAGQRGSLIAFYAAALDPRIENPCW